MRDLIYMGSFLASAIAIGKGNHALEPIVKRLEEAEAELRMIRDAGSFVIGSRPLVKFPANDAGPIGATGARKGETLVGGPGRPVIEWARQRPRGGF